MKHEKPRRAVTPYRNKGQPNSWKNCVSLSYDDVFHPSIIKITPIIELKQLGESGGAALKSKPAAHS